MRTIQISITSTFQCEYCQCFKFKIRHKFKLEGTSHGGMYSAHYFGNIITTSKQYSTSIKKISGGQVGGFLILQSKINQLIAYKHLLSTKQKQGILNALQTG